MRAAEDAIIICIALSAALKLADFFWFIFEVLGRCKKAPRGRQAR